MVCRLLVCLQHDKAQHHTAGHYTKHVQDLKLSVTHLAYSPQLMPCGSHFFWSLKNTLHGRHFRSFEVVNEVVHNWQAHQPKDFVSVGICGKLDACEEHGGHYIED